MTRFTLLLCVMFGLLMVPVAHANSVSRSMSAEDIKTLLEDAGLGGRITEDRNTGAPVAYGKSGGIDFVVRALECSGRPAKCRQLLFFANFDLGREVTESDFRIVNEFNDSGADGRAYVIEKTGQIGVDYYVDLTGGVTPEHISSRVDRWQRVLNRFIQKLSSSLTGS